MEMVVTGVFTLLGTLLGVALGLFGERWLRQRGKISCEVGELRQRHNSVADELVLDVAFTNDKDINVPIYIRVEFHREGREPVRLHPQFLGAHGRWNSREVLNLPARAAIHETLRLSPVDDQRQAAKEAHKVEFVADLSRFGTKRIELAPPW